MLAVNVRVPSGLNSSSILATRVASCRLPRSRSAGLIAQTLASLKLLLVVSVE